MSSRRVLLRHLWSMIQTRAEAAVLVVQLQRTAVTQGLLFYGIAAVTALSFMTAVIVWIAVAAPPEWRGWALGIVALALLATALYSALTAGRQIRRDAGVIADFSRGLKLDLAMINLALKDPETEDADEIAERERAKAKVREAAAEKAATPSTAEGGGAPAPDGPAMETATAAMRAATPRTDVPTDAATPDTGKPVTATPVGEAAPRPATGTGYAFTAGGTYASTSSAATLPEAVTEREMPESLLPPDETAGLPPADTERKQRHGSP